MDKGFSKHAAASLMGAKTVAKHWGHPSVAAEHLLFAALEEGRGAAAPVMQFLGANPSTSRLALEATWRTLDRSRRGVLHLDSFKRAVEEAVIEAAGSTYVNTLHLLLGIAALKDDWAPLVLGMDAQLGELRRFASATSLNVFVPLVVSHCSELRAAIDAESCELGEQIVGALVDLLSAAQSCVGDVIDVEHASGDDDAFADARHSLSQLAMCFAVLKSSGPQLHDARNLISQAQIKLLALMRGGTSTG